ncbi:Uncharacterized protein Fot_36979 [Forsythia ovata]|uniref:Uncharacterized protein n=1 Tax=Forsythia ovata TaxID=205694 RepID=A0ABD1SRJ4_9LAMI
MARNGSSNGVNRTAAVGGLFGVQMVLICAGEKQEMSLARSSVSCWSEVSRKWVQKLELERRQWAGVEENWRMRVFFGPQMVLLSAEKWMDLLLFSPALHFTHVTRTPHKQLVVFILPTMGRRSLLM